MASKIQADVLKNVNSSVDNLTLGTSGQVTVGGSLNIGGNYNITGSLTLGSALSVANGGTGLQSLTAGYIPYGNGTSAFNSNQALTFDGAIFTIGYGSTNRALQIRPSAGYSGYIQFTENAVNDRWSIGCEAGNGDFIWKTGSAFTGSEKIRLTSGGQLVVGATSAYGNIDAVVSGGSALGGTAQLAIGASATDFEHTYFRVDNSGYANFSIDQKFSGVNYSRLFIERVTGNVGIGTVSPEAKLNPVISNTTAYSSTAINNGTASYQAQGFDALSIGNTGANGFSSIFFNVNSPSGYAGQRTARIMCIPDATASYGASIVFANRDTAGIFAERLRIDSSGNLNSSGTLVMGSSFKRNRIINGDMRVDQRNAGAAVTLNNSTFTYGVDRWAGIVTSSTSTVTTQRVSIGSNGFQYGTRLLRGSGTFTGNGYVGQCIESVNTSDLAGKNITISYWARKGSASTGVPYIQLVSGTGTDQGIALAYTGGWTGWVSVGTSVPALTTTLAQYTATFTVPAGSNELAVFFVVQGYTGTGSANDYIDITGVQFEEGSVATPYERQIYSDQLAQCQRYYEKSFPLNTAPADAAGYYGAITSEQFATGHNYLRFPVVQYKVVKRTQATVTFYNPNIVSATYKAASENPASTTVNATIGYRTSFSWDECFFPLLDGGIQTTNNAFEVWCSNWTAAAEL